MPVPSPLVFGIYPGGGIGAVTPLGPARPEDPAKRLAALERLRGTRRAFVLHLYAAYDGQTSFHGAVSGLAAEIDEYTRNGFLVEAVLRYRPRGLSPSAAVNGYAGFVRSAVRRFGPNPRVVALQVTNEANVPGAPDAADGAYAGVRTALVRGVIAAKREARRRGHPHLRVGFNWAAGARPSGGGDFWRALRRLGGRHFARAVDWVGVDVYPGTWSPPAPEAVTEAAVRATVTRTLRVLRGRHLRLAGLPARVGLRVAECGYPTGPGRSYATQAMVVDATVAAVHAVRRSLHVTDLRWFDLRDAASGNPQPESQYGLLRDDYTPKPAFGVLRSLVARLGAPAAAR